MPSTQIAIRWFESQGNREVPPGLDPAKVALALYKSRHRIASFLAQNAGFQDADAEAFVAAVMAAPAAIYEGTTMRPIDWAQIGSDAVEASRGAQ